MSNHETAMPSAERIALAAQHYAECHLCPHSCGPARATAAGVCRVGRATYVASEMLHMGEESELAPAHAIFFSGCTASCRFCTAAKFAFHPTYGVRVTPEIMAARVLQRQAEGARSICFIGGDPAPHIPFIVETVGILGDRRRIPTVFNSNFYLTDAALDLLDGVIDIYLPDLKFGPAAGPDGCGQRLGGMPDYWAVVTGCLDRVLASHGAHRVIVRHLLMPGHLDCCTRPVLAWLATRPGLRVSLLTQYLAPAHARGELAASLSGKELEAAEHMAHDLKLALVD